MENAFFNVLFGILGNLGFFILGLILNRIISFFKQCGKNKIWKIFSGKKIIIALSIRSGPLPTSTPRVSIAEVIALTEILPIFRNLKIDFKIVDKYSDIFLRDYDNLLSIGGPSVNIFTDTILKTYEKNYL